MADTIQGFLSNIKLGSNKYIIKDTDGRNIITLNRNLQDTPVGGYFIEEIPSTGITKLYKKTSTTEKIETHIDGELGALKELINDAITSASVYEGIVDVSKNTLSDGASTNPVILQDNVKLTPKQGSIVLQTATGKKYQQEFIWNGTKWNEFGAGGSLGAFAFVNKGIVTITIPTISKGTRSQVSVTGGINVSGALKNDANVTGSITLAGENAAGETAGTNKFRYTPRVSLSDSSASLTAGNSGSKEVGTSITQAVSSLDGTYIKDSETLELSLNIGAVTLNKESISYKTSDPTLNYTKPKLTVNSTDFSASLNNDAKATIDTTISLKNQSVTLSSTKSYLEDVVINSTTTTGEVSPVQQ